MKSIVVSAIKDTKNPEVKQLELRTNIEKPVAANPVSFFLEGLANVAPSIEKRVAYQSVSTAFIAKHNIEIGTELTEIPNCQNAQLVVKESNSPRTWLNSDGTKGTSQPKINPSSGEILKDFQGRNIYRDTILDMTGLEQDVYIKHISNTEVSKANLNAGQIA